MKNLLPWLLLATLTGCWKLDEVPTFVDALAFEHLGGTLFANPDLLSLKEIHLDAGGLAGREIIIEGKVAEVSDHSTYLILTDDSARMLVVLTDLASAAPMLAAHPTTMRILGTVESGKKGLPFVKAKSVSLVKKEGEATPVPGETNAKA